MLQGNNRPSAHLEGGVPAARDYPVGHGAYTLELYSQTDLGSFVR